MSKRFYGWYVVFALSIAGGFSAAMGIGNFGIFINPMSSDMGIGQAPFGWAQTARLVGFALSGPIIGRVLDRYGTRMPLAIAAVLYTVAVGSLGLVSREWQMICALFVMGSLGFWGSSTLYFHVLVAKWFVRQRGKAMSIMFVGVPLGIGISAPVTQVLIELVGWREAWMLVAGTGGVVIFLLSLLVVRNRPEDMGLEPDGAAPTLHVPAFSSTPLHTSSVEHSWALDAAVRTGTFWRLAIAFGTLMLAMGALSLFWVPYYTSKGFPAGIAALGFSTQAFSQVLASLILARVLDRVELRFVAVGGFIAFMLAFLATMAASQTWHLFLAGFLSGTGIGTVMLLQTQMWPAYFGRRHIGAIRGMATPVTLGFSALGGASAGVIHDATGSYAIAWWAAFALLAVGGTLIGFSPRPRPDETRARAVSTDTQ